MAAMTEKASAGSNQALDRLKRPGCSTSIRPKSTPLTPSLGCPMVPRSPQQTLRINDFPTALSTAIPAFFCSRKLSRSDTPGDEMARTSLVPFQAFDVLTADYQARHLQGPLSFVAKVQR
jgi:hypothetical protein